MEIASWRQHPVNWVAGDKHPCKAQLHRFIVCVPYLEDTVDTIGYSLAIPGEHDIWTYNCPELGYHVFDVIIWDSSNEVSASQSGTSYQYC